MQRAPASFAKTSRPNLPNVAPRPRLFSLLDEGRDASMIWLAGPPGSGKTTLVADYLDTFADDYLWYQIDPSDADVATFFHYIGEALGGGTAQATLPAFKPEYLGDLQAFARRFFRTLFSRLATPFAIVFDNYQDLPLQSRLHEVMRDGLAEVPEGGCVVFISRQEPPPSMARFRANSRLKVIGWEELKLTHNECVEMARMRGLDLAANVADQLFDKTQGWAAGLVLMLEQLRSRGTVSDLPQDSTPKVVFDYLAGELLSDYDEDDQRFLFRTAILPRASANDAIELSGREDGDRLLARLASSNFMISARTDGDREIYQFHPLLREFLLNAASVSLSADEIASLRSRAATLLESSGDIETAVRLRAEIRDWRAMGDLIRRVAPRMLEQGRGETLDSWLQSLPDELLSADPWLTYWLGQARFAVTPRESRRLFERAFRQFEAAQNIDIDGLLLSCAGVLDASLHALDDLTLLDPWLRKTEELFETYGEHFDREAGMRLTCNMYMSLVFREPFHRDIESWGERTYGLLSRTQDAELRLQAALRLVSGIVWTGRFSIAFEIIESVRALADSPDVTPVTLSTLRNIESMYFMLVGDHESCMAAVKDGVALAETNGIHIWRNSILLNGMGSALCAGELELAHELVAQLDKTSLHSRRFDLCIYHYFSAWLAMLENDLVTAHQHLRSSIRLACELGLPFFEVVGKVCQAQVLFACNDERAGADYLREVRSRARKIDNHFLEFLCFIVFADVAFTQGRESAALRALSYALTTGRQHGYSNCIWWQPKMMARLAVHALQNQIEEEYVRTLVLRRELTPDTPPLELENWPWKFRVRTLGGFALSSDSNDSAVEKLGGRPLQLLQTAIALGGRDVSIERITDAMWPRIDADYANRSFNTTLHRLRKSLHAEQALSLQGGKLNLSPFHFWIDVWALDRAVADHLEILRGQKTYCAEEERAAARKVIELYRGPFMGDEDAPTFAATREKLKNRIGRWLLEYSHRLLEDGRTEDAISILESGIEADETAEGLYRQLMRCYAEEGRRAEAIEAFNRCRTVLADRLGVAPSEETSALHDKLTNAGA